MNNNEIKFLFSMDIFKEKYLKGMKKDDQDFFIEKFNFEEFFFLKVH